MKEQFQTLKLIAGKYLFALLLCFGLNTMLIAQNIDYGLGCPNADAVLADQVAGGTITLAPIIAIGGGAYTIAVTSITVDGIGFCPGAPSCGSSPILVNFPLPDPQTNITFTITPTTVTVSSPAISAPVGTVVRFTLVATSGTLGVCQKTYSFTIARKPVDIALVLDKSGSMSSNSGASSTPRWSALTSAVGLFMTNLENFDISGAAGDKIGLSFFDNGAVAPASGFPTALITTVGSTAAVNGNLSGPGAKVPGGGTAFGAGLQDGFGKLPADPLRSRIIIAFTDGEQNIPNTTHVNVFPAGPTGKVRLGAVNLNTTADPVKIYPIGIGAAGSLPAVLSAISTSSEGGGLQISTEDGSSISGNFGSHFINVLQSVLSSGSPQIVDTRLARYTVPVSVPTISFGGFETVDSFTVNKNIKKLVFNVISNAPRFAITSVKKDGIEFIPNHGKMDTGIGFRSYALDLDARGLPSVSSEGTWTIKTRAFTRDLYEISLLVDDHSTRYTCLTDSIRLNVGKTINIQTTLNYGRNALKNATVQALMLMPGDDLGHLLATTPINRIPGSDVDPSSPGIQKYLALLKDSAFVRKLLANKQLINLSYNAADSMYSGQFSNTVVSGVYNVVFLINSGDTLTGDVIRYQKNSIYVYFPEVDLDKSNVNVTANTQSGSTILTFRPVGINGKFIGPGWDNAIILESGSAKIQQVTDNGDGSYSISITGSFDGKGKLSIGGETVFEGDLERFSCYGSNASFIQKLRCFILGLGLPGWATWLLLLLVALIAWILYKVFKKK